jgi:uncharacterized membrane protein (UPF0127 family)
VKLRHETAGITQILATEIEMATGVVGKSKGLMFRRRFPEGAALVMPFESVRTRGLHSIFVFVPFEAIWVRDETVTRVAHFEPFRSFARAPADLIVELPEGAASGVTPGDRIALVESPDG